MLSSPLIRIRILTFLSYEVLWLVELVFWIELSFCIIVIIINAFIEQSFLKPCLAVSVFVFVRFLCTCIIC